MILVSQKADFSWLNTHIFSWPCKVQPCLSLKDISKQGNVICEVKLNGNKITQTKVQIFSHVKKMICYRTDQDKTMHFYDRKNISSMKSTND